MKAWKDSIPQVNTNKRWLFSWFSRGAKWNSSIHSMAVGQNETGGANRRLLVHVSTYQGSMLVPVFEPQPHMAVGPSRWDPILVGR